MALKAKPFGRYDLSGSATLNYRFKTLIGSAKDDTVTINKKYLGSYGSLNLGAGTDTVSIAGNGDWKLLLKGVESISAAQDATALEIVSDASFETNGSFTSITGGYGIQNITFTSAARDNTVSLGDLTDKVSLTTATWVYNKSGSTVVAYDTASSYKITLASDVETLNVASTDVATSSMTDTVLVLPSSGAINIASITLSTVDSVAYNAGGNNLTLTATQLADIAAFTGGAGTDQITMSAEGTFDLTSITTTSIESINGSSGNDSITDNGDAHDINGGAGNDTMVGAGGADSIYGEDGDDTFQFTRAQLVADTTVVGGDGTDILELTAASTAIVDADFTSVLTVEKLKLTGISSAVLGALSATAGLTTVVTGDGATQITTSNTTARTIDATLLAQNTALTLLDDSVTTNFTVSNLVGNVTATTVAGTLTVTCADAADNGITIATGTGNTTVTGGAVGDTITVTGLATATQTFTGSGAIFNITAGANAQTITGGALTDTIDGGAGSDSINGGAGNDYIVGGYNSDTIAGGTGSDYLRGTTVGAILESANASADADTMFGGAVSVATSSVFAESVDSEVGTALNGAFDTVYGPTWSSSYANLTAANIYEGKGGNDILVATSAKDIFLYKTFSQDTLDTNAVANTSLSAANYLGTDAIHRFKVGTDFLAVVMDVSSVDTTFVSGASGTKTATQKYVKASENGWSISASSATTATLSFDASSHIGYTDVSSGILGDFSITFVGLQNYVDGTTTVDAFFIASTA